MHMPLGGRKPAQIALLGVLLGLALFAPARGVAARCSDRLPLRPTVSCGQKVSNLQWLVAGHRPSVFTKTKPTFRGKPNGYYGARTKAAVLAMKYRIGYPRAGECGLPANRTYVNATVGARFLDILQGRRHRPTCWVAL